MAYFAELDIAYQVPEAILVITCLPCALLRIEVLC
jgi:hypothetical protein